MKRTIYGIAEIAEALGTKRKTVWAWVQRGTHSIPEPDERIAAGPVWCAKTIDPWIKKRRMEQMGMEMTTYSDGTTEYDAIHLTWQRVREILGREHQGHPEDDEKLIAYLLKYGAPEWVGDAEGWIDEYGWGVIGPKKNTNY